MATNLVVGLVVLVVTGLLLKLMSEYRRDENRQLSERVERLEAENAHLKQENRALHLRLGDLAKADAPTLGPGEDD